MYLLDSIICIYIIKNRPGSVMKALKRKWGKDMFISSISVAGLQYGVEKSMHAAGNRMSLLEFLPRFRILYFYDRDAVEYGRIRAGLENSGKII